MFSFFKKKITPEEFGATFVTHYSQSTEQAVHAIGRITPRFFDENGSKDIDNYLCAQGFTSEEVKIFRIAFIACSIQITIVSIGGDSLVKNVENGANKELEKIVDLHNVSFDISKFNSEIKHIIGSNKLLASKNLFFPDGKPESKEGLYYQLSELLYLNFLSQNGVVSTGWETNNSLYILGVENGFRYCNEIGRYLYSKFNIKL